MILTDTHYRNSDGQEAQITLVKQPHGYAVQVTLHGHGLTSPPDWNQTTTTEQDAHVIIQFYATKLKTRYGMERIRHNDVPSATLRATNAARIRREVGEYLTAGEHAILTRYTHHEETCQETCFIQGLLAAIASQRRHALSHS
jgi:hypothetical protein